MKQRVLGALMIALCFSPSAFADDAHHTKQAASQSAEPLVDGEVRKVDKEANKITIRHGAIQNLDMPPMTMVFQVKDAAVLEKLKVGDKIRFQAQKVAGQYTATRIERAQ